MSRPKNTTAPPQAQDRQRLAYQAQLGNASVDMGEAGNFIWALGALLVKIYNTDSPETALPDSLLEGLAKGLRIVGARLMDEGAECSRVLNKDWAAPQIAEMPNCGAEMEAGNE